MLLTTQDNAVHSDLPKETRFTKDFETYVLLFTCFCHFLYPFLGISKVYMATCCHS